MGTRHLILVQIGGDYRIAQYGQWDGYPTYQGIKCLRFARAVKPDEAVAYLGRTRWLTAGEIEEVEKNPEWAKTYPFLSRDCGADILWRAFTNPEPLALNDSRSFAGNSLFCEWAYVLDYDAGRFEVYGGGNKRVNGARTRFPSDQYGAGEYDNSAKGGKREYHPVRIMRWYPMASLPSDEAFLADFEEDDKGALINKADTLQVTKAPPRVRMRPQRVLG